MSKKQTTTADKKSVTTDFKVAENKNEKSKIKYQVRQSLRKKGGTYFYSAGIAGKKNVFVTPEYMDLLVNAFRLAELQKDIKNLAYVVMPNHFLWIFRLSENQDDPMQAYRDLKMNVAKEILQTLRQEAQEDNATLELLDIFRSNNNVKRSHPRRIIWSFKEEAKKIEAEKKPKYKIWEPKSKLFLLNDEKSLIRNVKFLMDAPVRDRWQLVDKSQEYPYLYVADEVLELI